MWPDGSSGRTLGSEQVLTIRMIICNKLYTMQGFYYVTTKSASKYQFIRILTGVQKISDDN